MLAAGLLAKKAVEAGLDTKPWVKTSLAPGSRVVTEYLDAAGLTPYLDKLGFSLVGYGCTTCIGNSGPLPDEVAARRDEDDLAVVAVLSGNRNFEGRIHPQVRASYLASPPLVVAYALAGTSTSTLRPSRSATGADGTPVYLRDLWPIARGGRARRSRRRSQPEQFEQRVRADLGRRRALARAADARGSGLRVGSEPRPTCRSRRSSTDLGPTPSPIGRHRGRARASSKVGRLDHHRPHLAGRLDQGGLARRRVPASSTASSRGDFNSYGARRGNHEVMMRGTFANIRLRNELAPGPRAPWTTHLPDGEVMTIFDAAMRYQAGRGAARRPGGQGVRQRLRRATGPRRARAPRRARGDRRELRADPPSNLVGHGHPPAAVRAGGVGGDASGSRDARRSTSAASRAGSSRGSSVRGRGASADGGDGRRVRGRRCGSTAPPRWTTTATAASCRWCCGRCSPPERGDLGDRQRSSSAPTVPRARRRRSRQSASLM